jgi:hypothetical protein
MAKLESENAISDDLETSKFKNVSTQRQPWWRFVELPLPICKHAKSAPLTSKYFKVLPPKETQSSSEKR